MKRKSIELIIDDQCIRPANYVKSCREETRKILRFIHGIEQPTERQIAAYILYGDKSLNRRTGK